MAKRDTRISDELLDDRATAKLIHLATRGVSRKWKNPPKYWQEARVEFSIRFGDRFRMLPS